MQNQELFATTGHLVRQLWEQMPAESMFFVEYGIGFTCQFLALTWLLNWRRK